MKEILESLGINEDNFGVYEPIHGSAPDIANKNVVNPIATILSELDAEKIFNLKWISKPNFGQIVNEYKNNILNLNDWHTKRFGHLNIDYVHAGSVIYKK